MTRFLFGGVVFLAAFLLFLVEPMAAKQLLPAFGGSAAVWLTCLVFFQTALLAGYIYAHWMVRRSQRWSLSLYIVFLVLASLSALVWSFHRSGFDPVVAHPVAMIFWALLLSIGLPFILLGATSPLLQAWIARRDAGRVPYRLFALSNTASLLALVLYPTLIEPHLTLRVQRILWSLGFVCFVILSGRLAWGMRDALAQPPVPTDIDEAEAPAAPRRSKLLWLLLPMVAAMQLSAVTSYLTQNIAAIPLLWILPLAVYLVTLIVAFQFLQWIPQAILVRLLAVMLAGLGYMLSRADVSLPTWIAIAFFLVELFLAGLFLHGNAYTLRPERSTELTGFYLLFAAGGALGAFLIGIAAPLIFSANYDLAISFFATATVAVAVVWPQGWSQRLLWAVGGVMLLYVIVLLHAAYGQDSIFLTRNFYGSLRVKQTYDAHQFPLRTLSNGTIQHGTQIFTPEMRRTPTTYYAEDSGVGLALRFCCAGRSRRIGVVGLGAGTLAAYGKPGDQFRFYEINPAVLPIAQHLFTYLRDSPAQTTFVEGDARASLTNERPNHFDVLVIDAFSGDAIPLHLLTTEAVALYRKHLAPDGILAFHVSNQHVDLAPEVYLLAQANGMQARTVQSLADDRRGEFNATWVLVTKNAAFLTLPPIASAQPTEPRAGLRLWTDDYSSLLPLLR